MLEEAIEARLVLPEGSKDEAFATVRDHAAGSDRYELAEVQETLVGDSELFLQVDGDLFRVLFDDGASASDGDLVRVRHTVGRTLEETSDVEGTKPLRVVRETVVDLYAALDAFPRAGFGVETYQNQMEPVTAEDLPPSRRRFLTWLDLFPPDEVESVGRERLRTAPAAVVEGLDDGAVLLVSKHPVPVDSEQLDAVADHVGIPPLGGLPPRADVRRGVLRVSRRAFPRQYRRRDPTPPGDRRICQRRMPSPPRRSSSAGGSRCDGAAE